jgi:hypothetical protein
MAKSSTDVAQRLDYASIIDFFTNPHTQHLFERQAGAIYRVIRHNPNGYVRSYCEWCLRPPRLSLKSLADHLIVYRLS